MNATQPSQTTYTVLPNGIHLIAMHESSREAVDAWLTHMTTLMDEMYSYDDNTYAPVLLDLREPGMMPVGYATHVVRQWSRDYPHPPIIDLAVVYRYGMLASLAVSFASLSRLPDGVQLFHKGRYDDAVSWLENRMAFEEDPG